MYLLFARVGEVLLETDINVKVVCYLAAFYRKPFICFSSAALAVMLEESDDDFI